ncbi:MAG TPA: hypothetical protein VKY54_12880 [Kiloniellales bacterium]|jgi:hypothetical protein|nr:hypothetical protein [Kiloniellales bacterium]
MAAIFLPKLGEASLRLLFRRCEGRLMGRWLSRVVGGGLLAAALLLLLLDLWRWRSGETENLSLRPLGEIWFSLDPGSLNLVQAVIERYLLAFLWDPLLLTLLTWAAAPILAALGIFFLWLGARS